MIYPDTDDRERFFAEAARMEGDPGDCVTTTTRRTAAGSAGSTIPYFFLDRYIPSYLAEWTDFVAMVRDGAPSPVTLHDGRAPLVIGLAAWRSVREARPAKTKEITP